MIGQSFVEVKADASNDILLSYFSLYDMRDKEVVQGIWDKEKSNGFSCNFTNVANGVYLIAVVALALDPNEPIASDWRAPLFVLS